jgi:hypothetical protein
VDAANGKPADLAQCLVAGFFQPGEFGGGFGFGFFDSRLNAGNNISGSVGHGLGSRQVKICRQRFAG